MSTRGHWVGRLAPLVEMLEDGNGGQPRPRKWRFTWKISSLEAGQDFQLRLMPFTLGRPLFDGALGASPPMQPKAKAKRHECPTCGSVTGSPSVEPKLNRSRLNLGPPWMLATGEPLLGRTHSPQMTDKEPRWMADRRITGCMPRVTHSIGVGWLKVKPGQCQTFGGASKQAWLEWRTSKQARLVWPCR